MARLMVEAIEVEGFGSYLDRAVLPLGGMGPVAIVGDNGAGKSTIASKALVWGLFGKAAPERMGSGTRSLKGKDVICHAAKRARVAVTLVDRAQGTTWVIVRERARSGSDTVTVTRHDEHGATVVEHPEETIQAVLGCDFEVFTRTCVRGQGDVWAFAEATDARKREILDTVSGSGELDADMVKAKDAATAAAQRATTYARLATEAEGEADRIRRGIAEHVRDRDGYDAGRTTRIGQLERDVATLEAAEAAAKAADEAAVAVQAQRAAKLAGEPTLDLGPYDAAIQAAEKAARDAHAAWAQADAEARRIGHLEPGHDCPTCGQVIAPTAPVAVRRAAAEKARDEAAPSKAAAEGQLTHARKVRGDAVAWLDGQRQTWRSELAAIPSPVSGALAAARRATAAAREQLEAARRDDNPYRSLVVKLEAQLAEAESRAASYRAAAQLADRDQRLASSWHAALSPRGARAHLAETTLAAIEGEANDWLNALSSGTMRLEFAPTKGAKEDIQTTIHVRTPGGEVAQDLLSFSGGERARINMACDLGVAAVSTRGGSLALSLLVLDENVFSGLDERGKAAIVQALHGVGVADIVVIDHDPRLAETLPRKVKVSRDPATGYSTIGEA